MKAIGNDMWIIPLAETMYRVCDRAVIGVTNLIHVHMFDNSARPRDYVMVNLEGEEI